MRFSALVSFVLSSLLIPAHGIIVSQTAGLNEGKLVYDYIIVGGQLYPTSWLYKADIANRWKRRTRYRKPSD